MANHPITKPVTGNDLRSQLRRDAPAVAAELDKVIVDSPIDYRDSSQARKRPWTDPLRRA